jgi:RNA polymerase sigma factor (sigma-70 family)
MNEQSNEFRDLMSEVRSGSEDAEIRFLEMYGDHIYRAVRRAVRQRLNRVLRPRFDSQDFVQAVWASFFRHRSQVVKFERFDELVAFLTRVAGNKVIDECRHRMQTQKANVNRECSIDDGLPPGAVPTGREPAPSQVAIAKEQWERMTDGIPSRYRRILELRADGETHEKIAKQLDVNEKTVRRVLRRLLSRLEQSK